MPFPVMPAAYSGPMLYAEYSACGVKHVRPTALHCACVGGVVPVATRCASVIDGRSVAVALRPRVPAVNVAASTAAVVRPTTSAATLSGRFMFPPLDCRPLADPHGQSQAA